jgi:hypothetical protein
MKTKKEKLTEYNHLRFEIESLLFLKEHRQLTVEETNKLNDLFILKDEVLK